VRILPRSGWQPIDLQELWRYRELLWILALRDVKVRYKQTVLGAAWAVIQPVLTMVVFSIFFGSLAGLGKRIEGGIPYPLYTFCALLPWQLFSSSLTSAGTSLVGNQGLISKVYFPRLVIPLASIFGSLVDFFVAFVVLAGMIAAYVFMGYPVAPSWAILTLPLFVALAFLTALAVGLWLSALNVEYRDVRYLIPFIVQFWMFVTPIAYPSSLVRDRSVALYRLYGLNPMVGVVDGFRWAMLGGAPAPGGALVVSIAVMLALLIGGLYYFRRMERTFADLV
jgi:lipopolysaccharide transport system permease protein